MIGAKRKGRKKKDDYNDDLEYHFLGDEQWDNLKAAPKPSPFYDLEETDVPRSNTTNLSQPKAKSDDVVVLNQSVYWDLEGWHVVDLPPPPAKSLSSSTTSKSTSISEYERPGPLSSKKKISMLDHDQQPGSSGVSRCNKMDIAQSKTVPSASTDPISKRQKPGPLSSKRKIDLLDHDEQAASSSSSSASRSTSTESSHEHMDVDNVWADEDWDDWTMDDKQQDVIIDRPQHHPLTNHLMNLNSVISPQKRPSPMPTHTDSESKKARVEFKQSSEAQRKKKPCPFCGKHGHVTTRSKNCDKNSAKLLAAGLAPSVQSTSANEPSPPIDKCCINWGTNHKSMKSRYCLNYKLTIQDKCVKKYFGSHLISTKTQSIKFGLNQIITNPEIKQEIQAAVDEISKFKIDFTLWFEFLLRHKSRVVLEDMKKSNAEPDFYTLYAHYLKKKSQVSKGRGRKAYLRSEILEIFEEYEKLNSELDHKYEGDYRGYIMKDSIAEWTTNFKNNIQEHYEPRLKEYFKSLKNKENKRKYNDEEIQNIMTNLLTNKNIHKQKPDEELFDDYQDLDFRCLADNTKWWKFIGFFMKMQNYINFKLSPICRHGLHHMTWNSSSVHETLRKLNLIKGTYQVATHDTEGDPVKFKFMEMWEKFAIIPNKYKNFAYTMDTDGVAVTIHCLVKDEKIIDNYNASNFKCPYADEFNEIFCQDCTLDDDEKNKEKMDWMIDAITYNYTRLVGLDPGLRAIFGGIIIEAMDDFLDKNKQERFLFNSSYYHWLTHFHDREKKRRNWTSDYEKTYKEELKKYVSKNKQFSVNKLLDYVNITTFRLKLFQVGQPLYAKRKVARLRFDQYINTQIVNDMVANYILTGKLSSPERDARLEKEKEIRKREHIARRQENCQSIYEKNQRKKKKRREKEKERRRRKKDGEQIVEIPKKQIRHRRKQARRDERRFKGDQDAMREAAEKAAEELKERRKAKRKRKFRNRQQKRLTGQQMNNNNNDNIAAAVTNDSSSSSSFPTDIPKSKKKRRKKKQKSIKVEENKEGRTLVVMGDTSITACMKGYRRVSLKSIEMNIYRRAKQPNSRITLIHTNEFRTTKLCSYCFSECTKGKSPHRNLICKNVDCRLTWHRDNNAPRNILLLGLIRSGHLPAELMKRITNLFKR